MRRLRVVTSISVSHRQRCQRRNDHSVPKLRPVACAIGEERSAQRPAKDITKLTLQRHQESVIETLKATGVKFDVLRIVENNVQETRSVRQILRSSMQMALAFVAPSPIK